MDISFDQMTKYNVTFVKIKMFFTKKIYNSFYDTYLSHSLKKIFFENTVIFYNLQVLKLMLTFNFVI